MEIIDDRKDVLTLLSCREVADLPKTASRYNAADWAMVLCPNCKENYTHVHHVGTLVGGEEDAHTVNGVYNGTFSTGKTSRRRSAVEVVFSCEICTEYFALIIQQHKGNTFLEIHKNVSFESSPSDSA